MRVCRCGRVMRLGPWCWKCNARRARRCPACGRVGPGTHSLCRDCGAVLTAAELIIAAGTTRAADPLLPARLAYYALRAAAGLPLFGPEASVGTLIPANHR